MNNDPLVFELQVAKNKPHSYRKDKPKTRCPFCYPEDLTDIYRQDGECIWLHNKFPTLRDTMQTVLIEARDHLGDLRTYDQAQLHHLMRFATDCYLDMVASQKYQTVLWYKNYGPHSGGSLIHPHMQLVGLEHEDGYKYLQANNFEGLTLFRSPQVEVNIAEHPVQGYIELNINALELTDLDLWADWIQAGAGYVLDKLYHGRFDSYNLFFYPRPDGGICAKYITRFNASPYFVGYKLSQVNDESSLQHEAAGFLAYYQAKKQN